MNCLVDVWYTLEWLTGSTCMSVIVVLFGSDGEISDGWCNIVPHDFGKRDAPLLEVRERFGLPPASVSDSLRFLADRCIS